MPEYETLRLEIDEASRVATLTLNRPERANAVNATCATDIAAAMEQLQADGVVRVVIITGAGKHFCAGNDLREPTKTVGGVSMNSLVVNDVLGRSTLPLIAAINGAAMGGGCEIALRCDLRVMAESATIGLPEIRFGSLPGWGGTQWLPRLVGPARAKEMIFSGRHVTAAEAERWGLVNYVVPDDKLMDRARELAAEIAQRPAYALATAKMLIDRSLDMDAEAGVVLERRMTRAMGTPEERAAERARAAEGQDTYRKIFGSAE